MDAFGALQVAIVGPGAIAEMHAEALRAAGCTLDAVVGPDLAASEEFAERHGCRTASSDLGDVLAVDELDAVAICSPSPLHAEQVAACLQAGKHVLCEIPLALSLVEATTLVELASRADRVLMVGYTMRFWTPVVLLRALVEQGLEPTHVLARAVQLRQSNVGWTGRARDWTDNVLWHQGAHVIDTALWLLDEESCVVHGFRGPDWPGSHSHMDVGGVLHTPRGRLATFGLSYHSRVARNDYLVVAEGETYHLADGVLRSSRKVIYDGGSTASVQQAALRRQDVAFVRAVTMGEATASEVTRILPAMRVLQSIQDHGRPNKTEGSQ